MKKNILLLLITVPFILFSQAPTRKQEKAKKNAEKKEKLNKLIKQEEDGALVFNKQSAFGFNFNTDGFGFSFEKGKYKTIKKTNIWWASLGERKHPKEEKLSSNSFTIPGLAIGNPFVYGKINNFYYFKLGFGQQRMIGTKSNKNGVAVSAVYGAGLSLGLLKPYYLEVTNPTTGQLEQIKYNNKNDSVFFNPSRIQGAGGFGKGFNEIKIVPGIHVKTALRFDYGKFNDAITALEVGMNFEYYTQEMQILFGTKPKVFFINGYIALTFGRRK